MRLVAVALLATSCDLANPCSAGEGSFDLFFVGDMEGAGWLELDAIPRIAGAPARLTGGGAYTLDSPDGTAAPLAGVGGLELTVAACARRDSTAQLDGGHTATDLDSGSSDTGAAPAVGLRVDLEAQAGGWSGTWTATGPDGDAATGKVVAAAR